MSCFICRDELPIMYHLCVCNESTICLDCYELDNVQNMVNCGICRKKYRYRYNYDCISLLKNLFLGFLIIIIFLFLELFPPIYIYYETTNKNKDIFLYSSLVCVSVVNILNFYFVKKINDIKILKIFIYTHYSTILGISFVIFISDKSDRLVLYTLFILGINYFLPLILICINIVKNLIIKYKNNLILKYRTKKLKINKIIYLA